MSCGMPCIAKPTATSYEKQQAAVARLISYDSMLHRKVPTFS